MTALKKPVSRRVNMPLGGSFGPDRKRRVVVTLIPGNGRDVEDVIELRPEGTRRVERLTVNYAYLVAIKNRVNAGQLEKARQRKAAKQQQRVAAKERRQRASWRIAA